MARIVASLLLLSALLGAGPARAQSAGSTIAGPFTVILPSTSTFSFARSFSVPTPIQGSYLLRVELGTPNSLTTLSVRLNGAQLYSLSDFAGGATRVDRVVTLAASNTLSLSVAGAKGTRITLTVFTVVMPQPTALDPNPLPLVAGTGGTLTATLAPAPTASGTLVVASSDPSVASVPGSVAFASGQTSVAIPVSALAGGTATVTASANGGQAAATVNVDARPSVNLTSPTANSIFQAGTTIAIEATAADSDGTVAQVNFYVGTVLLGSAVAAPYRFTWASVPAGSYSLSAVAVDNQGASTTSGAVTVRVNALPAVALTNPASGATLTSPATIQLNADASDADGSIAQVDFYQGSALIGSATTAPYTFSWTNVTPGSYALTARATDNDGAVTISDIINVTVNSGVKELYYIVPDHLNTPRLIANQQGTTVWKWDQAEPFGASAPNADPDGDGVGFDFPLRFPGQYADRETSLYYNYFRYYDQAIGRFPQSDPIGLRGGLNTYAYVRGMPLQYSDPTGLWMPWIHKMMTEEALERAGCEVDGLPLATADVDIQENSQRPENAAWHHMKQGWQTIAQAQAEYDKYLQQRRSSCETGDLARVLHAIQDGFSPSHRDFQTWTDKEGVGRLILHGLADMFPSPSSLERSTAATASEISAFMLRCPCVCR